MPSPTSARSRRLVNAGRRACVDLSVSEIRRRYLPVVRRLDDPQAHAVATRARQPQTGFAGKAFVAAAVYATTHPAADRQDAFRGCNSELMRRKTAQLRRLAKAEGGKK